VRRHARQVLATGVRVDDLVVDGFGQKAQGGDRRTQVMAHGRDQVTARTLGVREPAQCPAPEKPSRPAAHQQPIAGEQDRVERVVSR
jgi:hypothetical protein